MVVALAVNDGVNLAIADLDRDYAVDELPACKILRSAADLGALAVAHPVCYRDRCFCVVADGANLIGAHVAVLLIELYQNG